MSGPRAGNHASQDAIRRVPGEGCRHRPRRLSGSNHDQPGLSERIQVLPRHIGGQEARGINGSNAASKNEAKVVAKAGEGNRQ
jgi:hypothetical protein